MESATATTAATRRVGHVSVGVAADGTTTAAASSQQQDQHPTGYAALGPGTPVGAPSSSSSPHGKQQSGGGGGGGANDNDGTRAGDDADDSVLGRKLNLCEFLLYNSLLFGMCFAKKGGPPIFACPMAGCCCLAVPPRFDVRCVFTSVVVVVVVVCVVRVRKHVHVCPVFVRLPVEVPVGTSHVRT